MLRQSNMLTTLSLWTTKRCTITDLLYPWVTWQPGRWCQLEIIKVSYTLTKL